MTDHIVGVNKMVDPQRLRDLAETLDDDDWEHPLRSAGLCRDAADELERLRGGVKACDAIQIAQQAEIERLHTWDGLMSILDEHWPESLIPTKDDDTARDTGARIVSMLRWVERLRGVMRVVASMPGRDWLAGQLALAEALDGNGGEHLDFVMKQAEAAKGGE